MRKLLLFGVLLGALAVAGPASAITYGQPTGPDKYQNVGTLVGTFSWGTGPYCSGTLISPTVFLTAAHCEVGDVVCVTFDATYSSKSKLYCGRWYAHPEYGWSQDNPNDVAVIVFDKPIRGIEPAQVASLGLLDQMKADGTLNQSTAFTSVGYGSQESTPPHGNSGFTYLDIRQYAVGYFNSLSPGYLRVSQNPNTGSGGTCYGDSGGPIFLGDTDIVVAITTTGDMFCKSTNVDQRLDIPSVQEFLGQFVAL